MVVGGGGGWVVGGGWWVVGGFVHEIQTHTYAWPDIQIDTYIDPICIYIYIYVYIYIYCYLVGWLDSTCV